MRDFCPIFNVLQGARKSCIAIASSCFICMYLFLAYIMYISYCYVIYKCCTAILETRIPREMYIRGKCIYGGNMYPPSKNALARSYKKSSFFASLQDLARSCGILWDLAGILCKIPAKSRKIPLDLERSRRDARKKDLFL